MKQEKTATVVLSAGFSEEDLGQLTLDLARDLREVGVAAELHESPYKEGERGGTIALGHLAIVFLTSGAATALISCLRAYLKREPTLEIEILGADGAKASVNAKNVDLGETKELLISVAESLRNTKT